MFYCDRYLSKHKANVNFRWKQKMKTNIFAVGCSYHPELWKKNCIPDRNREERWQFGNTIEFCKPRHSQFVVQKLEISWYLSVNFCIGQMLYTFRKACINSWLDFFPSLYILYHADFILSFRNFNMIWDLAMKVE